MKTVSQVTKLTGVSARTLQYYDEIGLLKPSELTASGYRLYDDEALQTLQQILFFKELGFKLKYNLEHFSEIMEKQQSEEIEIITQKSDDLYSRLTADLSKDVFSDEIQHIIQEIENLMQENVATVSFEKPYWNVMIDAYSGDYIKAITDTKYGKGASEYIVKAFQYYANNYDSETN